MLLDTSGLICFLNRKDPEFTRAHEFFESARKRLTHNYVLAELIPLVARRRLPREIGIRFARQLRTDPSVEVVFVTSDLHDRALNLLEERPDKHWSLCDAVSFELMKDEGILEALTTDHDFEQAGFTSLLRQAS